MLVVAGEDQVEQRRIQTGQAFAGNFVVRSGLDAGDRVIVEGIQKVRPGEKVQVSVLPPTSTTPEAAAGAASAPGAPAPTSQPRPSGAAAAGKTPEGAADAAPQSATPAPPAQD